LNLLSYSDTHRQCSSRPFRTQRHNCHCSRCRLAADRLPPSGASVPGAKQVFLHQYVIPPSLFCYSIELHQTSLIHINFTRQKNLTFSPLSRGIIGIINIE